MMNVSFALILSLSVVYCEKVSLIVDSDVIPWWDDISALYLLHSLADKGRVEILATLSNNKYQHSVAILDIINTYFNKSHIPVGAPHSDATEKGDQFKWAHKLRQKYLHKVKNSSLSEHAVTTYRMILSANSGLTILSLGFFTNLDKLLISKPDEYSHLNGMQLVMQKVKLLVCMAGNFPAGREYNIYEDALSAKRVLDVWPTEVLFSGFEIGHSITLGVNLLSDTRVNNSPIKDAIRAIAGDGHLVNGGYDPVAALVAVDGVRPYFRTIKGRITINETDGSNGWDANGDRMSYLVPIVHEKYIDNIINTIIVR